MFRRRERTKFEVESLSGRFGDAQITMIDFAEKPFFTDPVEAAACVQVFGSNGVKGFSSHLTIHHDLSTFIQRLLEQGITNEFSLSIIGGSDDFPGSMAFLYQLLNLLKQSGYCVSTLPEHCDIGGNYIRSTTMYRDRLSVKKVDASGLSSNVFLHFPSISYEQ
jgi:hypothetical protein